MTAATVDTNTTTEVQAEAEKDRPTMYKFSRWVHVGVNADACDERFTGKCEDDAHFHAWIRMPNPYQVQDIVEKAEAAKARRMRLYRDPESDPAVILQDTLEEIRASVEDAERETPEGEQNPVKLGLVDEIVDRDFQQDYSQAVREVDDQEDEQAEATEGKAPKKWAHIDADREEHNRQKALPEDQRSEDFTVLEKTMADYSLEIERVLKAIQKPRHDSLMGRSTDELLAIVRRDRIDNEAGHAYLQAFNLWRTYVCTLKPAGFKPGTTDMIVPKQRVFGNMEELRFNTPIDVVEELAKSFRDLETAQARDRLGKGS